MRLNLIAAPAQAPSAKPCSHPAPKRVPAGISREALRSGMYEAQAKPKVRSIGTQTDPTPGLWARLFGL